MGKKPDQIERDIELKRRDIGRRIEGLQHRVQDDVNAIRTEAKDRSSTALEGAKENLRLDSVKQLVEDHTLSTVAGAMGVGVLLGVVSEGLGSGGGSRSRSNGSSYEDRGNGSSGGSGMAGMLTALLGPAASTAQDELQSLVRDGFETLKGQVRQVGHEDKRVENRDVGVE